MKMVLNYIKKISLLALVLCSGIAFAQPKSNGFQQRVAGHWADSVNPKQFKMSPIEALEHAKKYPVGQIDGLVDSQSSRSLKAAYDTYQMSIRENWNTAYALNKYIVDIDLIIKMEKLHEGFSSYLFVPFKNLYAGCFVKRDIKTVVKGMLGIMAEALVAGTVLWVGKLGFDVVKLQAAKAQADAEARARVRAAHAEARARAEANDEAPPAEDNEEPLVRIHVRNSYYARLGLLPREEGSITQEYIEKISQNEIRRAYRKLALQTHPDRGGSNEEFQPVDRAYRVLSNPDQRRLHDLLLIFG